MKPERRSVFAVSKKLKFMVSSKNISADAEFKSIILYTKIPKKARGNCKKTVNAGTFFFLPQSFGFSSKITFTKGEKNLAMLFTK
jgi:hypothetical protein